MFLQKWTSFLAAILFVALILQGYGVMHFKRQRDALWDQKEGLEKKQAALEKKYAQEKARVSDLLRLKAAGESQANTCQTNLEKLRQEHEALLPSTREVQKKVHLLEDQVQRLEQNLSRSEQGRRELKRKTDSTIQDLQTRIALLSEEKQMSAADLQRAEQSLAGCREDNASLAALMEELMQEFRQKGVMDSLLQKEPFTQIRRVEVEEMLQKYREAKSEHVMAPPVEGRERR